VDGRGVSGVDASGVDIGPDRIAARTVVWAAGVQASRLARSLGAPLDRAGWVRVLSDLTVPGQPGVAPAAIQMGVHAAQNVLRAQRGEPLVNFRYRDEGSLATIGRRRGVAAIRGLRLSGLVAWLAWLGVHIFFLIGFRNCFVVLFTWAWAYLTYDRSARLFLGRGGRDPSRPSPPRATGSAPSSGG
jgi:NADH dehydrogenase